MYHLRFRKKFPKDKGKKAEMTCVKKTHVYMLYIKNKPEGKQRDMFLQATLSSVVHAFMIVSYFLTHLSTFGGQRFNVT